MRNRGVLLVRFVALWNAMRLRGDPVCEFMRITRRYTEKHRAYHTLTHIADCLKEFDRVRNTMRNPVMMELAFWYHDVIYNPKAKDNEEKSAQYARKSLFRFGTSARLIEDVTALILATKHHAVDLSDRDRAAFIDIDLSILGSDSNRFAVYERGVRREYNFVPDDAYREGRGKFFDGMLARDRIFATRHFQNRFENRARHNLVAFR